LTASGEMGQPGRLWLPVEKWDNREDFDCQWRNGTTGKTLTASGEMGQPGRLWLPVKKWDNREDFDCQWKSKRSWTWMRTFSLL
jgi:hypothetical protein